MGQLTKNPSQARGFGRRKLRQRGGPLWHIFIDDEVQTGFGRTGRMFGLDHYQTRPDISRWRGIANGLPLDACTTSEDVGEAFEPGDHLSTFGDIPVSCAAELANIDYLVDKKLPEEAERKGRGLMQELEDMKRTHRIIGDARGKRLMIGVELVRNLETKEPASEEAASIRAYAGKRGILVGHDGISGNVLRLQPPLVISVEELDQAINILGESFEEVEKKGA